MKALWRISNHGDLVGLGGERADGRWHSAGRGKRIVYLSEHPALALVEVLANLKGNPRLFPESYQMLRVEVPEGISSGTVAVESWLRTGGRMCGSRGRWAMPGWRLGSRRCCGFRRRWRRSRGTCC